MAKIHSDQAGQRAPDNRIAIGPPGGAGASARLFVRGAVAAGGLASAETEVRALGVADGPLAGVDAQMGQIGDEARPFR